MSVGAGIDGIASGGPKVRTDRVATSAYGPPWNRMNGSGVTAGGTNLKDGVQKYIVAADPKRYPLGTRLYISPNPFGYDGTFLVDDTGGAIKGNRIDFYIASGRAAQLKWGRRPAQAVPAASVGVRGDSRTRPVGFNWGAFGESLGIPGLGPGGQDQLGPPSTLNVDPPKLIPKEIIAFFRAMLSLFYPDTQRRIGKVLLGLILLMFGANALLKASFGVNPIGRAGKVAKTAAAVAIIK